MYVPVYIYARMCYIYTFMSGNRHQGQWRRKCKFTCVCFIITHVCVIHRCSGGVVLYLQMYALYLHMHVAEEETMVAAA